MDRGKYQTLLKGFYLTNPNYIIKNLVAVEKELIFQGFIKLEDYTDKDLRNKKTRTRYDYIMANQDILGTRYIYPKRLSGNYKILYKRGQRFKI